MEPEMKQPHILQVAVTLVIAVAALTFLVSLFAGCGKSSPPATTVWQVGGNVLCCEMDASGYKMPYFVLDCGEVGDIYVFSTAANSKIPCEGSVK
jgi:hypothetical protein